jgi:transcriptional regulator with GAF, ATPase, and Fis domain
MSLNAARSSRAATSWCWNSTSSGANASPTSTREVMTEEQMRDLQIKNIIACLKMTNGKVSGDGGAANLLGIRPTTLYSRIKKFGISDAHVEGNA